MWQVNAASSSSMSSAAFLGGLAVPISTEHMVGLLLEVVAGSWWWCSWGVRVGVVGCSTTKGTAGMGHGTRRRDRGRPEA